MRGFLDYGSTRKRVYDSVIEGLQTRYPLENDNFRLELSDLKYTGPDAYDTKRQKEAILRRQTLSKPLQGTWSLIDKKTEERLDEKRTTVARIPYLTGRGTYIIGGNEYTLANQARLKSGVYTRTKDNGEHEAHFNILKGGPSFRLFMEPKTGVFRMQVGQARLKLYPILRAMGISDGQLGKEWGGDLLHANIASTGKKTDSTLAKAWERMANARARKETGEQPEKDFRKLFDEYKLNPEVTQRTLGKAYDRVSPESMMRATNKLININKGEEETDDRDSLAFQDTYGAEDLFKERFSKDAGQLGRRLMWRAALRRNLKGVNPGALNKQIEALFFKSGLSQPLEEVNLMDAMDQNRRVTRMGEGGIPSHDSVPLEARSVQPSHLGFIDPVRTPESMAVGVDSRLAYNTFKGADKKLYTRVRNSRTGKTEYQSPGILTDAVVAFPGELEAARAQGYKKVRAMQGGRIRFVKANKVDYEIPTAAGMFDYGSNLVPMTEGIKGGRLLMGSKMITQALPLSKPEAPLVQSADEDGVSFENKAGDYMGVVRADEPGTVTAVGKDNIRVKGQDGKTRSYNTYDNFPMNRKSFLSSIPKVKAGDVVKPGSLLASSNMTDADGTMALGKNLRVAYMPYKGYNFEDAIVLSEGAAQKLSSEHMYTEKMDKDSLKSTSRSKFRSIFPKTFNAEQLAKLDDNGVVVPGQIIEEDDPLILGTQQRTSKGASMLYRGKQSPFQDASVTWKHATKGMVTDVWADDSGVKVAVKTFAPMQVGDKMCYDDETEVLTADGWKLFKDLGPRDKVASLTSSGVLEYMEPAAIHKYDHKGVMYYIESQQVNFCVTDTHRQYVRRRGAKEFELAEAHTVYGKRVQYKKHADTWTGSVLNTGVKLPDLVVKAGQSGNGTRVMEGKTLPLDTYLMLMGMFLSDGNLVDQPKPGSYGIEITQIKPKHRRQMLKALDEHSIKYSSYGDKVRIHSKALLHDFRNLCGTKSYNKKIDPSIFEYPRESLQVLFKWLMWGDGHSTESDRPCSYHTTSKQLADDVQRLCLHIGYAANIYYSEPGGGMIKGKYYDFRAAYRVAIITKKLTPQVNHGHTHTQHAQSEGWIDYDGKVWCCTLPRNHVLYVRRNGKPAWSGNSGRVGDKGVVGAIVPEDQMPTDAQGRPLEVILNPLTVISRQNPSQIVEAVLGKIAAVTGKPYKMPPFSGQNLIDYAVKEMEANGINDTETLFDPEMSRSIPDVLVGNRFFMKLHHTAEAKSSGRGLQGAYTAEGVPAQTPGESDKPKRVGFGELQALISHGAIENIRDIKNIRGQRNDDYWRAMMLGFTPPSPKVPNVYRKFLASLQGAGINVKKKGEYMHLMALTDKDIDQMSSGEIKSGDTVKWMKSYGRGAFGEQSMEPVDGGLFDRGITGGHGGNRWSHIKLNVAMPQPVMEDPIRSLLGLTKKEYENVISGESDLPGIGTGTRAITEALSRINVDTAISDAKTAIKSTSNGGMRDKQIKRLKYLDSLQRSEISPKDLVVGKVPVMPPIFRPITATSDFTMVSGTNRLYMDLMQANDNLKQAEGVLEGQPLHDARRNLYKAFKAVTGLGDPVTTESVSHRSRGLLSEVFGNSPKFGSFQRRLLGMPVDLAGRAAISPNPELDMDQVGIPEDKAWQLYSPFVVRKLVRSMAKTPDARAKAIRMVKERTPRAREALADELDTRPVLATRAPALHRYSLMAFKPVITNSKTLQLSPQIVTGFNADFDGDAMNFHPVVGERAVREAKEKMLPSRNLRSPADFGTLWLPRQEFLQGLFRASTKKSGRRMLPKYKTEEEVIAAFRRGEINIEDVVSIKD